MRVLDMNGAVGDLREGRVDEAESYRYLLARVILGVIGFGLYSGEQSEPLSRFISVAVDLLIAVVGLGACYRANQRGDGKDFVKRYICLSLPVSSSRFILVNR